MLEDCCWRTNHLQKHLQETLNPNHNYCLMNVSINLRGELHESKHEEEAKKLRKWEFKLWFRWDFKLG